MVKSIIRKFVLGSALPQEYLCVSKEAFQYPLKVYFSTESRSEDVDVTDAHLFLGYKPVIIGIPSLANEMERGDLSEGNLHFYDNLASRFIATLKVTRLPDKFDWCSMHLFRGIHGKHSFLPLYHKAANAIYHKWKGKGFNNILLEGNLYDQVRIAYSVPRAISVVSLGDGDRFNMFPTDLNGLAGKDQYVISLRIEGKAAQQVSELKELCLSSVDLKVYKEVYALGQNHMQSLKPLDSFRDVLARSDQFHLPLPGFTLSYRELVLQDHIDAGIHRIFFFNIINEKQLVDGGDTLSHVHQYSVSWRMQNGYKTEYFLR